MIAAGIGLVSALSLISLASRGQAQTLSSSLPAAANLENLIHQQQRLDAVIYRLSTAATSGCNPNDAAPVFGVMASEEFSESLQTDAAKILGAQFPSVISIAPGGPAELAGIRIGDQILAVNNLTFNQERPLPWVQDTPTSVTRLRSYLQAAQQDLPLSVKIRRGSELLMVNLTPAPGCPVFGLVTTSDKPMASQVDGQVKISLPLMSMTHTDDELAFIVGHELAHFLNDQARAPKHGSSIELDADLTGIRLAKAAGFHVENLPDFLDRIKSELPLQARFQLSHPGFKKRSDALRAWIAAQNPPAH